MIFFEPEELLELRFLVQDRLHQVAAFAALPTPEERRDSPVHKERIETLLHKIDFELGEKQRHEALRRWQVQVLQDDPSGSPAPPRVGSSDHLGLDDH